MSESQPTPSPILFPAPVGGVPLPHDFAPSIVFACAYGVLVLLGAYRLARRTSRNIFVFSTLTFAIERVVIWSLRAHQAHTPAQATSRGLTIYWQISFTAGYLALHDRVAGLLRCAVVATTRAQPAPGPDDAPARWPALQIDRLCKPKVPPPGDGASPDDPARRKRYRAVFDVLGLLALVPIVVGPIMGNMYPDAETDAAKGQTVQRLRYVAAAMGLLHIQLVHALDVWAVISLPRVRRHAVALLWFIDTIISLIPFYHIVVFNRWTSALTSTAPGSQNTPGEKTAFYAIQALAEFAAAALLLGVNIRAMFGTGPWGDPFWEPQPRRTPDEQHGTEQHELGAAAA